MNRLKWLLQPQTQYKTVFWSRKSGFDDLCFTGLVIYKLDTVINLPQSPGSIGEKLPDFQIVLSDPQTLSFYFSLTFVKSL